MVEEKSSNGDPVQISKENMSKLRNRQVNQKIAMDTLIGNLLDETEERIPVEDALTTLKDTFDTVVAIEAHVEESGYTSLTVKSPEAVLESEPEVFNNAREKLLVTRDDGTEFTTQFHVSSDPYGVSPDLLTIVYCEAGHSIDAVSIEEGVERLQSEIIEAIDQDEG